MIDNIYSKITQSFTNKISISALIESNCKNGKPEWNKISSGHTSLSLD